ncbi:MAG: LuxR C-terminal-related transcriptional regulator [Clostridiales bacterium]|nr:LuxR C-terminal-related transcriptional regulator [Clostridiales bacterium]MCC8112452.1 LuxR C-terminal-related transcriptional regulator [Bacteroidales bacterium]
MDILRRELNEIYLGQGLGEEHLSEQVVREALRKARAFSELSKCSVVVTDIASDKSFFYSGHISDFMGLTESQKAQEELASSDEDFLYARMHPEDLVDLRMLEYEFFKLADKAPTDRKLDIQAYATVRMATAEGRYVRIYKGTRAMQLSPAGKLWLMLCTYDLNPYYEGGGTNPVIVNMRTGEVTHLYFDNQRSHILSEREKQVLRLIRGGKLSKEIADELGISVNTVSRHRQKILEKLSVDNSIEAVNAAVRMRLL